MYVHKTHTKKDILKTGQNNLLSIKLEYLIKGTKNTQIVAIVETI